MPSKASVAGSGDQPLKKVAARIEFVDDPCPGVATTWAALPTGAYVT
jgi:hypothetical protein